MNAQHFKEILHTVCVTKKLSVGSVAVRMGTTKERLNQYGRNGVPVSKKPMIMAKLRKVLFDIA